MRGDELVRATWKQVLWATPTAEGHYLSDYSIGYAATALMADNAIPDRAIKQGLSPLLTWVA